MPDRIPQDQWRFASAGLELAGIVGVLTLIGFGVDRWLGTAPWGVVVAAGIGIVGGLIRLVRDVTKTFR